MKTDDLVKKVVFSFVRREEMFTSLDISQEIKKSGTFVRNVTCRDWLHKNFSEYVSDSSSGNIFADPNTPSEFSKYVSGLIQVRGGKEHATLYRPNHKDPKDYTACNQVPLTPVEVNDLKKGTSITGGCKAILPTASYDRRCPKAAKNPDILALLDGDTNMVSRSISSVERIKIPSAIVKKLGWDAGALIDDNKAKLIKTDKPLPAGLKINKDFRLSIPRDAVKVPNPIKVRCDGYIITFEKA